VQLLDTNGNVLATTLTDANGRYTFNQQSGPAKGRLQYSPWRAQIYP
jgi:hypothetical protein